MNYRTVILCGGSGTRLWPESRKNLPKQFIPIINEKSLFELTLKRALKLQNSIDPIIVCNKNQAFLVKETLEKLKLNALLILEPEGKNTTAAIYLASLAALENDTLVIMPSDHLITEEDKFCSEIKEIKKHTDFEKWVTLGIKPNKPSDAYGYIEVDNLNAKILKVVNFFEKPTRSKAINFIKKNTFFWNAGIFLGKASMIRNSIQMHASSISKICDSVFKEKIISNNDNEINFSQELFSKIPSKSIDFAVMEFEKNIQLYPINSSWSDVGSWDAISEINNYKKPKKNIVEIDSKNNFIRNDGRFIATIGVENFIIIDNDNATLIAKKNESEKVKDIVKQFSKKGFLVGEEHSFEKRPWGQFENLLTSEYCKVKRLEVSPRKRLSLQYHDFRSEHWLVVIGQATIYLDGNIFKVEEGMSIDIPKKSAHYIHNDTDNKLVIIETQLGTYFGEDDIVRLDDPYKR